MVYFLLIVITKIYITLSNTIFCPPWVLWIEQTRGILCILIPNFIASWRNEHWFVFFLWCEIGGTDCHSGGAGPTDQHLRPGEEHVQQGCQVCSLSRIANTFYQSSVSVIARIFLSFATTGVICDHYFMRLITG